MHSHDRTLIASLGFLDPDKDNRTHDLACAYLAQGEVVAQLVGAPRKIDVRVKTKLDTGSRFGRSYEGRLWTEARYETRLEVPILKGQAQYQTTIGFMDALIQTTVVLHNDAPVYFDDGSKAEGGALMYEFLPEGMRLPLDAVVGVEVKINPVPVGDLLRQLNLYRSHIGSGFSIACVDRWIAALRYDIDAPYADALKSEGIEVVRLGRGFDAWLAQRKKKPAKLTEI